MVDSDDGQPKQTFYLIFWVLASQPPIAQASLVSYSS
jgi:hypothetical protein